MNFSGICLPFVFGLSALGAMFFSTICSLANPQFSVTGSWIPFIIPRSALATWHTKKVSFLDYLVLIVFGEQWAEQRKLSDPSVNDFTACTNFSWSILKKFLHCGGISEFLLCFKLDFRSYTHTHLQSLNADEKKSDNNLRTLNNRKKLNHFLTLNYHNKLRQFPLRSRHVFR